MAGRNICGCWYSTSTEHYSLQRQYLPQLELSSYTTIDTLSFTTVLTQTFVNPTSEPIKEARYTFPLYDGFAVTAFKCTVGDRVIVGSFEQKDKARKTFDDAVAKGESAGLLESLPVGIFASTLGSIPANATMVVNVTYGGELKHDAQIDGLRFYMPSSIAPRYGDYPGELLKPYSALPSRGMRVTVDLDMAGSAIRKIQLPSKGHAISVSLGNLSTESGRSTPQISKASVALTHETVELSTDFVLQILVEDMEGTPSDDASGGCPPPPYLPFTEPATKPHKHFCLQPLSSSTPPSPSIVSHIPSRLPTKPSDFPSLYKARITANMVDDIERGRNSSPPPEQPANPQSRQPDPAAEQPASRSRQPANAPPPQPAHTNPWMPSWVTIILCCLTLLCFLLLPVCLALKNPGNSLYGEIARSALSCAVACYFSHKFIHYAHQERFPPHLYYVWFTIGIMLASTVGTIVRHGFLNGN